MEGVEEQSRGGRTDSYTLQAPFRDGDSEANRQDTTQSHKRFHLSDKDRGRVCIVCINRMQKTVLWHGHRSILRMPASLYLASKFKLDKIKAYAQGQSMSFLRSQGKSSAHRASSVKSCQCGRKTGGCHCPPPCSTADQGAEITLSSFERSTQEQWG